MIIKIEADIPDRWAPYFCAMLRDMEFYGKVGSSRLLTFFSDGDGDYRPKFEFDVADEIVLFDRPDVETRTVDPHFGEGDWFYDAG
jgi:hypothetical protein